MPGERAENARARARRNLDALQFVPVPPLFFPASIVFFYVALRPRRDSLGVAALLAASVAFYAVWQSSYLWLLAASIAWNYGAGAWIIALRRRNDDRRARTVLVAGIAADLAVLGYYKYRVFALENLGLLVGADWDLNKVILPLGISFYTFTQIAFLVDAKRGHAYKSSFTKFGLFVTYFPHLVAGPILHHKQMIPQFRWRHMLRPELVRNVYLGVLIFILGLVKKTGVADPLSHFANTGYEHAAELGFIDGWITSLAYTFQLYFDFSGYSDMAVGLGLMMQIRLPLNFSAPYLAGNIQAFWRRWHITLSSFLRDYLYVPLGGNRQRAHDGVFGPGTSVDYTEYKLEMIRAAQPDTIALGSSRALGFQARYFDGPFVNAGSGMRSLDEGEVFLDEMLRFHTPRRILLAPDFWWFNKATSPSPPTYRVYDKSAITTDKMLLPYRLLSQGKLPLRQFFGVIVLGDRRNELTRYENTGVMGLLSSNGNRADGSMLYGEFALGGRTDLDPRFSAASKLVDSGTGNYEHAAHPDPERLAQFAKLLERLREREVQVFLVVPPLAPMIRDRMAQAPDRYRYIDELRADWKTLGVPVFDFHDAQTIPATDCEFVDGYHSGDITYLKMLVRMADASPALASVIRIEDAKRTITQFDGNVIDRSDAARFPAVPEKDFLLLGCAKR